MFLANSKRIAAEVSSFGAKTNTLSEVFLICATTPAALITAVSGFQSVSKG